MNTAIVYILTSLTLAAILIVARGSSDSKQSGNEFRYQSGLLKVLFVCSFIPIALVAFIFSVAARKPEGMDLTLFFGGGFLGSGLLLYGYKYLKSFVVCVGDSGITLRSFKGEKLIPFDAVKKAIYLSPTGHDGILALYDGHAKKIIEFSESIAGIEILARLIEVKSRQHGVLFEATDRRM